MFLIYSFYKERRRKRKKKTLICCSIYLCTHWFFFLSIFYWLCYYSFPNFFLPFIPPLPCTTPTLQHYPSPPLSSFPWVVHISSLASLFLILFLTSPPVYFMPTNYASYSLYLPSPILSLPLTTDNPPHDLHFSGSVPVLAVCLVFVF